MEPVKQLTRFYRLMVEDGRLGHTHVCLYMALFQQWNLNSFMNPVVITRAQVMRASKISSKATYHKCLTELVEYGYLRYVPSHRPGEGSQIFILK